MLATTTAVSHAGGLRSARACARCRASKIKCHNSGQTPCQACSKIKAECIFLPTRKERAVARRLRENRKEQFSSTPLNSDTNISQSPSAPSAPSSYDAATHPLFPGALHSPESFPSHLDALYTPELLSQAVGIFFTHFYTDIFFSLHEPSLRSAAQDGSVKPILAIAILTLTARFIPQLVKRHGSPVAACDYYANSIRSDLLLNADKPSLEIIHALLFLSMHDWGSGRGARAWIYAGLAIRTSFLLRTFRKETPLAPPFNKPVETAQESIVEESRVRVFWSMQLMEQFVTSGKGRIHTTYDERNIIRQPYNEKHFLWGTIPRSSSEGRRPSTVDATEDDRLPSEKSSLISVVDNWNRVSRWVSESGAKDETYPPWHPGSQFSELCSLIRSWERGLPSKFQYDKSRFLIHAVNNMAGPYGFLHLVKCTTIILLHREYLQFFPDRRKPYEGRIPGHLWMPTPEYSCRGDFWNASLSELFESARRITEIVQELEILERLMNTPFVGYAAFTAASMNMYLAIFPWVCPEHAPGALERAESDVRQLKEVLTVWPLAQQWYSTILRLYDSYKVFHISGRVPQSQSGEVIDAFHSFDRSLLDYGEIKPGPTDIQNILSAKDRDGYRHGVVSQPMPRDLSDGHSNGLGLYVGLESSQLEHEDYWDVATESLLSSMLDIG